MSSPTSHRDPRPRPETQHLSNGRFILLGLMALNLLALLAQIAIDFSAENLASASIVFASSMVVLLYLQWTPALQTHPLSTFAVFGFGVTTQLGALLGQTAYWTSLADNLRVPMATFALLAGFQLLALIAHTGYRWLMPSPAADQGSLPRQIVQKLGLYDTPTTGVLWFMGYVGLIAFLLGAGREGTFGKVMQGLTFLTWAPFLIPMYLIQLGDSYTSLRKQWPYLLFFAGLVVLLGLAANARQVMLSGFVTIALFALLGALRSATAVSGKRVLKLGVLGLVLAALAIPLSDLATAMVVARKVRGNVSAVQMVMETFYYFQRPEALAEQNEEQRNATRGKYDEHYFENPLLARLVETKFHDNSFYFVSTFSQSDTELLAETTADMFWVALPEPLIKRLGVDIDKKAFEFSIGDYLSHLSQGGPLGSRRTGSMLAQGVALLGAGFAVVYIAFCLVTFAMIDLLSFRNRGGQVVLSAVGMLAVWKLFQNGITNDSLHAWITGTLRTIPQNIVLFLLVATTARAFGMLLGGRSHAANNTPDHPDGLRTPV
ncbi:hypothetical protein [Hydrogenophaga sp.]|uniref:hypothetical protein n=1 Tax=Hydrogenophaga sp. TaxID=1904254 RepID=UPI002FCB6C4C